MLSCAAAIQEITVFVSPRKRAASGLISSRTGYNFLIDKKENIWIIDFGHSYVKSPDDEDDPFVVEFLNGKNGWNPNYK